MNLPETLGIVAGLFLIAGYVPYIYEVLQKKTTPSRASWFIWSLRNAVFFPTQADYFERQQVISDMTSTLTFPTGYTVHTWIS